MNDDLIKKNADPRRRALSATEQYWLDELFREHYLRLKTTAYYIGTRCCVTDPEAWAEDMTQEVFLRAADKADTLIEHPNIIGWLICTLKNVIGSERQKKSNGEIPVAEVWKVRDEPAYEHTENERDGLFPPGMSGEEEEILYRRHCKEQSVREIADALGITPEACRMRLHRAEQKYRDLKKKQDRSTNSDGFRQDESFIVQKGGAEHV